jgi:hypothetical protein
VVVEYFINLQSVSYRPDVANPSTGMWYVPKDSLRNGRGEACGGFLNINDATVKKTKTKFWHVVARQIVIFFLFSLQKI